MQHAAECLEQQAKIKLAQQEWATRWPGHCDNCLGHGGKSYAGTYWEPPDFDLCACWASGKCPRCGHQHAEDNNFVEDGEGPCENCGWDHQNFTAESAMPEPEDWMCYGDCMGNLVEDRLDDTTLCRHCKTPIYFDHIWRHSDKDPDCGLRSRNVAEPIDSRDEDRAEELTEGGNEQWSMKSE